MNAREATAEIIELPHEVIEITELTPYDNTFIGKRIERDGRVTPYPTSVVWWRQRVARCPATIVALCDYLRAARTRNVCLIRGAPANPLREKTRRQNAYVKERGDHGFTDEPTRLLFFDLDGVALDWRADPEGAVKRIVAQLGEPFASASFVWFFSATHGLETETVGDSDQKHKRWTGRIVDGKVRVRLAFITDRALSFQEAVALTRITEAASGIRLDETISRPVQPNYIQRVHWDEHPGDDVLGDCPTIGWVRGACETVTVPDGLAHKARWAKAQGCNAVIADHPDALSAVLGIGSGGAVRPHMMAAIRHLLRINPPPDHISYIDHSLALADKLATMIAQHEEVIRNQLAANGRQWSEVTCYLPGNMSDWACWLMERPNAFRRKTVKLARTDWAIARAQPSAQEIYDRVARSIEQANDGVTLVIAPTGSRKSTLMRTAAVRYVTQHPDESVVILVPRHRLGDEQVAALLKQHPKAVFQASV